MLSEVFCPLNMTVRCSLQVRGGMNGSKAKFLGVLGLSGDATDEELHELTVLMVARMEEAACDVWTLATAAHTRWSLDAGARLRESVDV